MRIYLNAIVITLLLLISASGCEKITEVDRTIYIDSTKTTVVKLPEYVITDYGAIGDGVTDCSGIINSLINKLPASGGTILIPEGDFLLNSPISVNRSFVTIKGQNPGIRSNVDVTVTGLVNPGGGSKLILGRAASAIEVPVLPDVNGRKNRISGLMVQNLLISGKSGSGTGINILQDNDGIRIENVIGINLFTGIVANASDAIIIRSCWISEVKNSIVMNNGIQNMISNCQLGAQPGGITIALTNQENMLITGNQIYPDGDVNLQMNNCNYTNVSSNNFQSYYIGIIEINNGNSNLLSSNMIWMRNPNDESKQLRSKGNDYGVIRVSGNQNLITSNIMTCDWVNSTGDPVSIRSVSGTKNSFHSIKFINLASNRLFYVNETSEIFDSAPASKIAVDGNPANVYISY
ncbi:MAG: glycosyl hydrolase family 28-related protein [Bacteroidota bacterium]|nr:glycosyl hydrolase family 28-related protein [Bacteroidota bacterium]